MKQRILNSDGEWVDPHPTHASVPPDAMSSEENARTALVKCVHCQTFNNPEETAGYCDECGKKLPGLFVLSRAAAPAKKGLDESQPAAPQRVRPGPQGTVQKSGIGSRIALVGVGLLACFALVWLLELSWETVRGVAIVVGLVVGLVGLGVVIKRVMAFAGRVGRRERFGRSDRVFVFVASVVAIAAGLNLCEIWSTTPEEKLAQPGKLIWYGVAAITLGVLGLVFSAIGGRNPKAPSFEAVSDAIDTFS